MGRFIAQARSVRGQATRRGSREAAVEVKGRAFGITSRMHLAGRSLDAGHVWVSGGENPLEIPLASIVEHPFSAPNIKIFHPITKALLYNGPLWPEEDAA